MGVSTGYLMLASVNKTKGFSNNSGMSVNDLSNRITDLKTLKIQFSDKIRALEASSSMEGSVAYARAQFDEFARLRDHWRNEHETCKASRQCKKTSEYHGTLSLWDKNSVLATKWAAEWKKLKSDLTKAKSDLAETEETLQKLTEEFNDLTGQLISTSTGNTAADNTTQIVMSNASSTNADSTGDVSEAIPKGVVYAGLGVGVLVLGGIIVALVRRK